MPCRAGSRVPRHARYVIELGWTDGELAHIRDFRHAAYVLEGPVRIWPGSEGPTSSSAPDAGLVPDEVKNKKLF